MYFVIIQVHKQRSDFTNFHKHPSTFIPSKEPTPSGGCSPAQGSDLTSSGMLSLSELWMDVEVNKVDKSLLSDFCGSVGLRWVLILCVCFIALL